MESSESVYGGSGGYQNSSSRKSYVKVETSEYSKFKIFKNNEELKKLKEFKDKLSAEMDSLDGGSSILKKMGQAKLKEIVSKIDALQNENLELVGNIEEENENDDL